MRQFFVSLWWWFRVAVMVIVGGYVLALLWTNSGQDISLWYWPGRMRETTSVVALALASFVAGGVVCTIGWALFTATVRYRRSRVERKRRAVVERREELTRKAAMLRVKPAPVPVVPRPAPQRVESIIEPPEPIEMELHPSSPTPTFSTGAVPVEVDQVVVLAPPPPSDVDEMPPGGSLSAADGRG